jgi:hypothetical protein
MGISNNKNKHNAWQDARHGERSAAIHAGEFGLLDCRASLAVTEKIRHSERSASIHL